MAGWNSGAVNLSEARLLGLQNALIGGLTDLNAAITYQSLWPAGFPITADMTRIGDVGRFAG